jgi:hypothetical protein
MCALVLTGASDRLEIWREPVRVRTFLRHIFQRVAQDNEVLPILITRRRTTAVEDLETFVTAATKIKKKEHLSRILLLVDGYDELSVEQRKRVSEAIPLAKTMGGKKKLRLSRSLPQTRQRLRTARQ